MCLLQKLVTWNKKKSLLKLHKKMSDWWTGSALAFYYTTRWDN